MKTESELVPEALVLLVLGMVPAWCSGYTYTGTETLKLSNSQWVLGFHRQMRRTWKYLVGKALKI